VDLYVGVASVTLTPTLTPTFTSTLSIIIISNSSATVSTDAERPY
jgi:hypothetical protein